MGQSGTERADLMPPTPQGMRVRGRTELRAPPNLLTTSRGPATPPVARLTHTSDAGRSQHSPPHRAHPQGGARQTGASTSLLLTSVFKPRRPVSKREGLSPPGASFQSTLGSPR